MGIGALMTMDTGNFGGAGSAVRTDGAIGVVAVVVVVVVGGGSDSFSVQTMFYYIFYLCVMAVRH